MVALGEALSAPTGGLTTMDVQSNSIEPACAELLVPYLSAVRGPVRVQRASAACGSQPGRSSLWNSCASPLPCVMWLAGRPPGKQARENVQD